MLGTIYKITNNVNQKVYVGQTIQKVKRRWKSHCCVNKRNEKMPIVRAIQKYGKGNFTFEVLETVSQEQLNSREAYYVALFDCNNSQKGYNVCDIEEGKIVATKEFRRIASETMKRTHQNPRMKTIARENGLKRRGRKIGGTSKFVGVSLNRQGKYVYWRATSSFEGKSYNLGNYKTEEEAAIAYNDFALKHFGSNAVLNNI